MKKYEEMSKSELINVINELDKRNTALEELIQKNNIIMEKSEKIGRFGIWKWDLKADKLTWSDGMYSIFGINRDEFTGVVDDVVSSVVHPEDRDNVRKINDILYKGTSSSVEFRIILPDGSERILVGEGSDYVYDEEGRPSELIGYVQDITERKKSEEKLREKEMIMTKAEKIAHFGSLKWDLKANKLTWSDGMYRLFGINKEEFTGELEDVISRAIHPEDREIVRKVNEKLADGKSSSVKFRIILPDGSERIVAGEGSEFLYDDKGNPLSLIGYTQDITEIRKTEEALQEKEIIMKKAVNLARFGSWKWNVRTNKVIWSDEVYNIFDMNVGNLPIDPDEIMSRYVHPEDINKIRELNEITLSEGKPASIEYRIILPDGKEKIIRSERGEFIYDENGNLDIIIGYLQDVTELKNMEKSLAESLEKYKVLFDSFPLAITIADKYGNMMENNHEAERILDISKEELILRRIDGKEWNIIRPDESKMPAEEYASVRALRENRIIRNVEMGIIKENNIRWIEVTAAPISDYGVAVIYNDITERKKMEQRIKWLASFPEFNPCLVMEMDLDGNIHYLNPASKKLIGEIAVVNYKKQCFSVLKDIFSLFRKNKCTSAIEQVKIGKYYYQYMIYYKREEHRIRIYGFDITGRKKIEEELIQHKYHLEELVEKRTSEIKTINENLQLEIASRRISEEKIKLSLQEKEILLEEIHHRVKNNLQIISSLLSLQANYIKDKHILDLFKESKNRIKSMALLHEILYKSMDFGKIDVREYIRKLIIHLFHSYGVDNERIKINLNIQNVKLKLKSAIHCGLIINELISNSLKYAFPEDIAGEITIDFHTSGDDFVIISRDNGIGLSSEIDLPNSDSLGLKLVMILAAQMDGTIELNRTNGTEFKIIFKE